jgi:hypothetical protein
MTVMCATVRALGPQDGVENQKGDERSFDCDVRPHSRLRLRLWGGQNVVVASYYIHRGNRMPLLT